MKKPRIEKILRATGWRRKIFVTQEKIGHAKWIKNDGSVVKAPRNLFTVSLQSSRRSCVVRFTEQYEMVANHVETLVCVTSSHDVGLFIDNVKIPDDADWVPDEFWKIELMAVLPRPLTDDELP